MTNLLELGLCGFYQNNGSCVAELSVGLIPAKPMVAWALPNKGLVKTCEILFLVIPPRYRGKKKEGRGGGGSKNRTIATMGIPFFEMLNEQHRRKNAFYKVFSNNNRKLSVGL